MRSLVDFAFDLAKATAAIELARKTALEEACKIVEKSAKDAMGDPDNGFGWPPLKEATIAQKKHGNTPLVETGDMKASIGHHVEGNAGYVGTADEKAKYHEFGTATIPARPFIGGAVVAKGQELAELHAEATVMAIKKAMR